MAQLISVQMTSYRWSIQKVLAFQPMALLRSTWQKFLWMAPLTSLQRASYYCSVPQISSCQPRVFLLLSSIWQVSQASSNCILSFSTGDFDVDWLDFEAATLVGPVTLALTVDFVVDFEAPGADFEVTTLGLEVIGVGFS